jgi:prepilin-type processing-associated H-X9-DG protein
MGLIALLMGILLPSLRGAIGAARGLQCQVNQREIMSAFQLFADDQFNEGRGDDKKLGRSFRLATFQDSLYGIDEFWQYGDTISFAQDAKGTGPDVTRCSEVHGAISFRRGIECTDGSISPSQNMSYGFNRRLHREEYIDSRGRARTRQVSLDSSILSFPGVPLLWDVDAKSSTEANFYPGFSAPSLGSRGPYGNNRFWRPALRHNGAMNVAFLDGHVASSKDPLNESSWRWSFQFGARR